ncbi:hypothetical protein [Halorubrum sp. Atlit-26R]|uniref:hypothetical protein n=1 Tax=Halorubrum sp. Atlit-26R TaxID=2282128 RepID=UPI000EF1E322|nr:hypothetical protein [Halorubrum sp. Atlit-26R]RLM68578.1 hypothetical protein DVK07_10680 [Halorubrum sp. Atlit-26R]
MASDAAGSNPTTVHGPAFAIVDDAWVVERDDGQFEVRYSTEGQRTHSDRWKATVPDREEAEKIAERFEGYELDPETFIP